MGRRLPVILHRSEVGSAYKDHARVTCLHHVTKQGGHVEVFWHKKDVAEILDGCCLHGHWDASFAYLFENEFEDVFTVFKT